MGLTIDGKFVDVDHSHNQLLNTGRKGNPVVQIAGEGVDEIYVYSTFQRQMTPRSLSRAPDIIRGDNCHLLYALKGKNGLHTSFGAIRRLMLYFDVIVEDMIDQSGDFDAIVPMPSGHSICSLYAKRLAARYGRSLVNGLFNKISKQDARTQLAAAALSWADRKMLRNRIGKDNGDFTVKDIPTDYRYIFQAVKLQSQNIPMGCSSFLLVDDLLASGSTLIEARRQLLVAVPGAYINAACLFSAI